MVGELGTVDDLLSHLGTGKWNILYFISTGLWFGFIPPQVLSGAYLTPALTPFCKPPDHRNVSVIAEDSCSYQYHTEPGGKLSQAPCTNWDYDTSVYSSSLTSDFNMVCDREFLRATYTGVFMMGNFISPLLGGYLADRYGRRIVVIVSLVIFTCAGFAISFLHNLPMIFLCRLLLGATNLPTFYILGMEVCESKNRATVGILTALPWALGTMAWGGMAYMFKQWRWLQVAVTIPNLILFPALWVMDESPRWLIVRGQHEKALQVVKKAARWNNVTLPPDPELRALMDNVRREAENKENQTNNKKANKGDKKGLCRFISTPDLCSRGVRGIMVIMCLNFFTASMVFYGLNLNGANLTGNPYIYMVLSGLMEVPAYTLTAPLISKFGRKKPTMVAYFICGTSILLLGFIPFELTWLILTLAMVGKMCISSAYQVLYVFITESLPTEIRIQGLGAAKVAARIGSITSPYITDLLGQAAWWAPSLVFGGMSLITGVATFWASETKGVPLPDTISDLQQRRRALKRPVGGGKEEEMVELKDQSPKSELPPA